MRNMLWAAGLAACVLAPHAAAQTDRDPRLPSVPVLSAAIAITDTAVTSGRVRNRAASQMADFYPIDGTGFHLSAGLRFFEARSMLRQNMKAMRDLVYLPYSRSNSGVHWGYRRVPSMAIGYTQSLDKHVNLGIEVGAMLGRATGSMRRFAGERKGRGGANPIVHLVVGVNF
jgi:hypothetical protein